MQNLSVCVLSICLSKFRVAWHSTKLLVLLFEFELNSSSRNIFSDEFIFFLLEALSFLSNPHIHFSAMSFYAYWFVQSKNMNWDERKYNVASTYHWLCKNTQTLLVFFFSFWISMSNVAICQVQKFVHFEWEIFLHKLVKQTRIWSPSSRKKEEEEKTASKYFLPCFTIIVFRSAFVCRFGIGM